MNGCGIWLSSAGNGCTIVCMIDNDTIEESKSKSCKMEGRVEKLCKIEHKKMQTSNTHTHVYVVISFNLFLYCPIYLSSMHSQTA